jgi:hypothetical protein
MVCNRPVQTNSTNKDNRGSKEMEIPRDDKLYVYVYISILEESSVKRTGLQLPKNLDASVTKS